MEKLSLTNTNRGSEDNKPSMLSKKSLGKADPCVPLDMWRWDGYLQLEEKRQSEGKQGTVRWFVSSLSLYPHPHPELSCTPRLSRTSATASGAHVRHIYPLVGGWVVLLYSAQALPGSPIVTPNSIQLPWNRPSD